MVKNFHYCWRLEASKPSEAIVPETMEIMETVGFTNNFQDFCYQIHGNYWFQGRKHSKNLGQWGGLPSRVTEEPLAHVCISSPRGFLCGTAYTLCTISASNHFEEVCRHQMPKHRAKAFRPACCLDLVERKVNVCVPWLHRLLGLRTLGLRAQRYGLKFPAARAKPVLERGNSEAVYGNKSR